MAGGKSVGARQAAVRDGGPQAGAWAAICCRVHCCWLYGLLESETGHGRPPNSAAAAGDARVLVGAPRPHLRPRRRRRLAARRHPPRRCRCYGFVAWCSRLWMAPGRCCLRNRVCAANCPRSPLQAPRAAGQGREKVASARKSSGACLRSATDLPPLGPVRAGVSALGKLTRSTCTASIVPLNLWTHRSRQRQGATSLPLLRHHGNLQQLRLQRPCGSAQQAGINRSASADQSAGGGGGSSGTVAGSGGGGRAAQQQAQPAGGRGRAAGCRRSCTAGAGRARAAGAASGRLPGLHRRGAYRLGRERGDARPHATPSARTRMARPQPEPSSAPRPRNAACGCACARAAPR